MPIVSKFYETEPLLKNRIAISTVNFAASLFLLMATLLVSTYSALSADPELTDGTAIVTTFSGIRDNETRTPTIDPRGLSVRALDLSRLGAKADGELVVPPGLFSLQARDIGQVFAIAFDDEEPANIFVAATSAYGLFRTPDNSDWARGMWGDNGGPGTIYKLDGSNGYEAEVFARVSVDGRANTGVGLGDISYDPIHQQLFVSDLESGLIHRFDVRTGEELGVYDHGVDGRTRFKDVETGKQDGLDGVPFNTRGTPNFDRCGQGRSSDAAARFMARPDCWNFASYKRRVWAVSFRQSGANGPRLYYSVWGSSPFGEPNWAADDEDATNSIWSVGLNSNGSFDATDVRREFNMPPFYVSRQDRADFGNSQPVASIVFLDGRIMLVVERGMHLGRQKSQNEPASVTGAGRVLRFVRGGDGTWVAEGRYDIGSSERENEDPPHIRAGATGGLGLGYGYNGRGVIDQNTVNETLWVSGTQLCDAKYPCGDAGRDDAVVHGLQGLPTAMISEVSPVDAFVPYSGDGPVTPDATPKASYFVAFGDANEGLIAGDVGDVAFAQIPNFDEDDTPPAEEPPASPSGPVASGPVDLGVDKSGPTECIPGESCVFNIDVTNQARAAYSGPIYLSDTIEGGLSLISNRPTAWRCNQSGAHIACSQADIVLESGQSLSLQLDFQVPENVSRNRIDNCVEIGWLGHPGREQVRAVQIELTRRGFNSGGADGVPGRKTAAAISAAETAFGMRRTGKISDELLIELFGREALLDGDSDPDNDSACVATDIDRPEPVHNARISSFHRSYRSSVHDNRTSDPIEVHNPALSNFHLRFRSSMHDGRTTRPVSVHRNRVSGFHENWESRLHETGSSRHATGLSDFHDRFSSRQHNPATSDGGPIHCNRMSRFHERHESQFHERGTSQHATGLSRFHARSRSNLHDPGTSRRVSRHDRRISQFHSIHGSRFHGTATSQHRTGLSQFHSNFQSNVHDRRTTNQRVRQPQQPQQPQRPVRPNPPPPPPPPAPEPPQIDLNLLPTPLPNRGAEVEGFR